MKPPTVGVPRLLTLLLLLPLTGCYYYAATEGQTRDPLQIVRAQFHEPSDVVLSNEVTVRSVVRVDGRPMDWRGDTLLIRASSLHQTGERSFTPPSGETMWIPRSRMSALQERRVDLGRSALLAGGVAAAGAGLGLLLFSGDAGGSESEDPDPEPPPNSRILRFVVPLPFFGGG